MEDNFSKKYPSGKYYVAPVEAPRVPIKPLAEMDSQERRIFLNCKRKISHRTEAAALAVAQNVRPRAGCELRAYICRVCGTYHIGNIAKK